jgi:thioredoxin-like negative regulator of GroEL
MQKVTQIQVDRNTYVWDGKRWYQTVTFLTPPAVLIPKLDSLLLQSLLEEDDTISDVDVLLERARQAAQALQYERSGAIARRVLKLEPRNTSAATVLCSALCALGRPAQALKETQTLKDADHAPLQVSRASALCDLERWPEAMVAVTRARETGGDECATLVAKRLKGKVKMVKPAVKKKPATA